MKEYCFLLFSVLFLPSLRIQKLLKLIITALLPHSVGVFGSYLTLLPGGICFLLKTLFRGLHCTFLFSGFPYVSLATWSLHQTLLYPMPVFQAASSWKRSFTPMFSVTLKSLSLVSVSSEFQVCFSQLHGRLNDSTNKLSSSHLFLKPLLSVLLNDIYLSKPETSVVFNSSVCLTCEQSPSGARSLCQVSPDSLFSFASATNVVHASVIGTTCK